MGFTVKCSINIYYILKVYIAIYPLPLVYGLYPCENVDNCEQPLSVCAQVLK